MIVGAPLEHRLAVPTDYDRRKAAAILAGRYELPRVPDMPRAHRILDIGAEIGAFAAWTFYLWPHAWLDCYEVNPVRAAYCRKNAPPGTCVHEVLVDHDDIAKLPPAQVVRVRGALLDTFFERYQHERELGVIVHEWRDESQRALLEEDGWRLATARVDHIGHGVDVWIRTDAQYDAVSDTHFVIGDEAPLAPSATTPCFALGITHTPWIEARVQSMRALIAALAAADGWGPPLLAEHRIFSDREPNHSWSGKMWSWAATTDCTHALFLQDDVWPAPNFWRALEAMVAAAPNEIIGLEAVHPAGPMLARRGLRWYASRAWLIGPGYVFPKRALAALLEWRSQQPRLRVLSTSEDTLINDWCAETGRRVLHPVPTIIDHDTSIASTYSNDAHSHRRPTVKWTDAKRYDFTAADLERVDFWRDERVTRLQVPKEAT